MPALLDNYLRFYRKQSGLTQSEVAFAMGFEHRAQFSRYERRRREPMLNTGLTCQAVFGVPVDQLFAGINEKVAVPVTARMRELTARIQAKPAKNQQQARQKEQKLRWLAQRGFIS